MAAILRREFRNCTIDMAKDVADALAWLDAVGGDALLVLDGGINLAASEVGGIRGLRRRYPRLLLAVVDWRRDREVALRAIGEGAHGYIPKDLEQDDMLHAFAQVMAGQVYVPPIVGDVDVEAPASRAPAIPAAPVASLTERQREVLTHMSTGKSNKEIARALRISESTVKVHLAAAFRLLGVHNRVGAAARLQTSGADAAAGDDDLVRTLRSGRRSDDRFGPKLVAG